MYTTILIPEKITHELAVYSTTYKRYLAMYRPTLLALQAQITAPGSLWVEPGQTVGKIRPDYCVSIGSWVIII